MLFMSGTDTALADEQKLQQIEAQWVSQYGRTHPFAQFEQVAKTAALSNSDMKSLGCIKNGAHFVCRDGIIVKNKRIKSVDHCKPSPFNMGELLERAGLDASYARRLFATMEETWNAKATHFTYRLSNDAMCVSARF